MTTALDETHDPARTSWVEGADGHAHFPIQNLPLGIFSPAGGAPRAGIAIGDHVLDLAECAALLPERPARALGGTTLNALFALPPGERVALRRRLSALLSDERHCDALAPSLHRAAACTLHLPCAIGDYSDFYAGIRHAENVGRLFRPDAPLLPNYKYVPIGYHGRASSVRVSGMPVRRPCGQIKPADAAVPCFGPTRRLDYEVELGLWLGGGNALGEPIPIAEAGAQVVGLCLLNDWSARDLQAWEYQPLGPFLAKSFATTVSPWVVTAEALAPFRIAQSARPAGDPPPLPYLLDAEDQRAGAFAITIEAWLRAGQGAPMRLSTVEARELYWTAAQLVAHHSSNGCDLRAGDLLGTGTISGGGEAGVGSLLERTRAGATPLLLADGTRRTFLEDGDEIALTARATRDGFVPIGFGEARAAILPAR